MPIPGNLLTTAMAVMPHIDVDRALEVALSLDIPFWPQLPHVSYYEDMYVQASEHFPGMVLDMENQTLSFSMDKFLVEFEETMSHFEEPDYFDISPQYSAVYHKFLEMDLGERPAIRGQLEGPISFGLNVKDQDDRPILFDDTVRPFLLEVMARRVNAQLKRLKQINPNAFMFIDEPGLQFIFSAMSGYNDVAAREDMEGFFASIERPRGVHLCGNPDWDFLLNLDIDVLSMDVYTNGEVFASYAGSIKKFLARGGTLVWGITPSNFEPSQAENLDSLRNMLLDMWTFLERRGLDRDQMLAQSLLSPATCCLVNQDGTVTEDKAFAQIQTLSQRLREEFDLA
jgi:hypothetical protein